MKENTTPPTLTSHQFAQKLLSGEDVPIFVSAGEGEGILAPFSSYSTPYTHLVKDCMQSGGVMWDAIIILPTKQGKEDEESPSSAEQSGQ